MPRINPFAAGVLLLALVAVAYAPATRNAYIWDDDAYVYENPTLPDPRGLERIWFEFGATPQYYPLVHTTFWLEYRLWGLEPSGYHVVNVFLHGLSAWLLWRLLLFLGVPGAWAAAAIFALHPVQVESVAWITERKNVLSAVCYLGAALTYLRFLYFGVERKGDPATQRSRAYYLLSLALFAAALLSKTVTCSLPAALLLLLWWKRGRLAVKDVLPLLPFFALGLTLAGVTLWMEKHRVGAVGADWDLGVVERLLIAGRAIWFYLGKLVWPSPLSFIYPRWVIDTGSPGQALYPVAALALAAALWITRARIGIAPIAAALLFAGTLLPALGFFDTYPMRYSFVADHFQYLASIAPITLFAAASAGLASRFSPIGPRIAIALLTALLFTLGALTWNQLSNYRDEETLWTKTIETNPGAWIAYYNLGNQRRREKNWLEAIRLYRGALDVKTDFASAHNNLASSLTQVGDLDGATLHFRRAVEIDDQYTLGHFNLASALAGRGHYTEAIAHYREAVKQQPGYREAHHRLGIALQQVGENEAARTHLEKAEEIGRRMKKRLP